MGYIEAKHEIISSGTHPVVSANNVNTAAGRLDVVLNSTATNLNKKVDKTYVDGELASKADASIVAQLQTTVNNKADASAVAALSSSVAANTTGITEVNARIDSVESEIGVSKQVQSERVFRVVSEIENEKRTVGAQCVTYANGNFVVAGNIKSNDMQKISVFSSTGEFVKEKEYTSSELSHLNGIAYDSTNSVIYTAGSNNKVCVINYDTLNISKILTLNKDAYAIEYYNGNIYVLTSGDMYEKDLYTVNKTTGQMTFVCSVHINFVNRPISAVPQDMTIKNGIVYLCYNRENMIVCADISTGNVIGSYLVGEGNGLFPYGELESATFVGNQLYILSGVWFTTDGDFIEQIFKTNIGGSVIPESYTGQSLITTMTLYVDSNSTEKNPVGTNGKPFKSLVEVSAFAKYNNLNNAIGTLSIYAVTGSDFTNESIELRGMDATIRLYNLACKSVTVSDGVYTLIQVSGDVKAVNAVVRSIDCRYTSYYQRYGIASFGTATYNSGYYEIEGCSILVWKRSEINKMKIKTSQIICSDEKETYTYIPTLAWNGGGTAPSFTIREGLKILTCGNVAKIFCRLAISDWGNPSSSDYLVIGGMEDLPFEFDNMGVESMCFGDFYINDKNIGIKARLNTNNTLKLVKPSGMSASSLITETGYFVVDATIPITLPSIELS